MPSLLIWARVQLFLMNNIPLIIMAAGVSSRMKTSNVSTDLSEELHHFCALPLDLEHCPSTLFGMTKLVRKKAQASCKASADVITRIRLCVLRRVVDYHDGVRTQKKTSTTPLLAIPTCLVNDLL